MSKEYDSALHAKMPTLPALRPDLPVCWRVHLLKRQPKRLPVLLLVVGMGAACVWLMFGTLLPVLAALLLLMGSVSEYLFPITYRLTDAEICQEALASRIQLPWKEVRRCRMGQNALLLTALPVPSRLDAFRGVLLRFAPEGQPGDYASVRALLSHYAPHVLPDDIAAHFADKGIANEAAAGSCHAGNEDNVESKGCAEEYNPNANPANENVTAA